MRPLLGAFATNATSRCGESLFLWPVGTWQCQAHGLVMVVGLLDSLEVVVSRDFLVGSRGLSNFYVGGSDFMLV